MLAPVDEHDRDEFAITGGELGVVGDRPRPPVDAGHAAYLGHDVLGHVTEVTSGSSVDDDPRLVARRLGPTPPRAPTQENTDRRSMSRE